jgi:hypothetical protein
MENQVIIIYLLKHFEILFDKFGLKISRYVKKIFSQYCIEFLESFFILFGTFCEKKSKSILGEEDFLFILQKLGLKRYKEEINQEKKRIQHETRRLEKFYS